MDISNVTWRKASYSGGNGGACIEVGVWHKSSHSGANGANGANGGDCIDVASTGKPLVAVRDSRDPNGPKLAFTPSGWQSFIQHVRNRAMDAD